MRPRKRQTAAASFALLVLSPWLPEPTHAASPSTSSTEIRERLRRTAESALLAVQEQRRVKVELESAAATELHKYIDACALSIASETTEPATIQRAETTLFRLLETVGRKSEVSRAIPGAANTEEAPTLVIRGAAMKSALSRPCTPASGR